MYHTHTLLWSANGLSAGYKEYLVHMCNLYCITYTYVYLQTSWPIKVILLTFLPSDSDFIMIMTECVYMLPSILVVIRFLKYPSCVLANIISWFQKSGQGLVLSAMVVCGCVLDLSDIAVDDMMINYMMIMYTLKLNGNTDCAVS